MVNLIISWHRTCNPKRPCNSYFVQKWIVASNIAAESVPGGPEAPVRVATKLAPSSRKSHRIHPLSMLLLLLLLMVLFPRISSIPVISVPPVPHPLGQQTPYVTLHRGTSDVTQSNVGMQQPSGINAVEAVERKLAQRGARVLRQRGDVVGQHAGRQQLHLRLGRDFPDAAFHRARPLLAALIFRELTHADDVGIRVVHGIFTPVNAIIAHALRVAVAGLGAVAGARLVAAPATIAIAAITVPRPRAVATSSTAAALSIGSAITGTRAIAAIALLRLVGVRVDDRLYVLFLRDFGENDLRERVLRYGRADGHRRGLHEGLESERLLPRGFYDFLHLGARGQE